MEIWKDVKGYEGLYKVSNIGNVKSLKFNKSKKQKKLSLFLRSGYLSCMLCNGKTKKMFHVHRIVADSFIENIENKPCVNHINGIKTDNNYLNLEWVTYSENTKHAYKNNLINITENVIQNGKICNKKHIQKLTIDTFTGIYYDSYQYACNALLLNYNSAIKKYYRNKFNRLQYV